MSAEVALFVITWVVMALLYLGLARLLYEVRGLRRRLDRLAAGGSGATASRVIRLPREVTGDASLVVVAESSCPQCWATLETVAALGPPAERRLLTYEDPSVWTPVENGFRVVRDADGWSAVAHLAPPVLLRVDPSRPGTVTDVALPVDESDVRRALSAWYSAEPEGEADVSPAG